MGKGYTLCRVISIRIAASTVKDLVGWVKYRSRCQSLEENRLLEHVMFAGHFLCHSQYIIINLFMVNIMLMD